MKKVVLVIDSFKGSLTSVEAELAAEEGVKLVCPECEIVRFPIADGGEGLLEVLVEALGGSYRTVVASDPLMRPISTRYGVAKDGDTAIIEMAAVSGLTLLAEEERDPMHTTTFGTGELICDALNKGYRHFIIGIGGSATNDAGIGMLQALGFRFFDREGRLLGTGSGKIMEQVFTIDRSSVHPNLKEAEFTVACDVRNPFCGPQGAAFVFARQKGADDKMIDFLDKGMEKLAETILRTTGKDLCAIAGTGAAGGLGGALIAFLNAKLKPGIDLVLQLLDFERKIEGADLIVTGEGKVDNQTAMGKVPFGVLSVAKKKNIPVVVIGGSVDNRVDMLQQGFKGAFSIVPGPLSLETSMKHHLAIKNIRDTVAQIISLIQS